MGASSRGDNRPDASDVSACGGGLRRPGVNRWPAASAVEEPALEEGQDLLAGERLRVRGEPVCLEDAHIVLERIVRPVERVLELEPLEDDVLGPRLVRLAELGVDRAPDDPHGTRPALDPEDDAFLLADVVHTCERTLRVPPFTRASSHVPGIQSRQVAVFKNLFSFLFQRSSAEERVEMYVIREHDRGRSLDEILEDRYVQNRLSTEQRMRLLDRPEIIKAISSDAREAARTSLDAGAAT